jgi:aminodeoxyfutalosine deaminase
MPDSSLPSSPASDETHALRARWVFPVSSDPIEHGVVVIRAGQVVSVSARPPQGRIVELGNVALLPGLINCHAHLEFSDLTSPVGDPGMPFPEWIGKVVARRREQSDDSESLPSRREAVWLAGWREAARHGTAAIGEIATLPWSWDVLNRAGTEMNVTLFLELIGLSSGRALEGLQAARVHLEESATLCNRLPDHVQAALSPHAPYTVHADLLSGLVQLAADHQIPLAMHLAESPEELELLATGGGPFAGLLESLGVWRPAMFPGNRRPLDYLEALRPGPRTLIIHGNYLQEEEMSWIASQTGRMTVIYCPRTHAYFRHPRYPLAELLSSGVPVALGTDSRASNPDLSLWEEVRHVARHFPEIDGSTILRLGTHSGARALGWGDKLGVLEPGSRASMTIVPLSERAPRDPYEALWEGGESSRLIFPASCELK